MQCPNCNETLLMSHRQGIEIDYCPKCRGIWLDRGELDKIIERESRELVVEQPVPRDMPEGISRNGPRYSGDDYRHDKYRKKKSLLGELFDF